MPRHKLGRGIIDERFAASIARVLQRRALHETLTSLPFVERDLFVDQLLGLGAPPDDSSTLPRGAVPYVPCGVDAILACVRDAPVHEGDTFVDLGSGVGRVAALVHLLTGARAFGVELQRHLIDEARRMSRDLAIDQAVSFVEGDAALQPIGPVPVDDRGQRSRRVVYFCYASFSAAVLERVLDGVERDSRSHDVVTFCAVGFDVLRARFVPRASASAELALYDVVSR